VITDFLSMRMPSSTPGVLLSLDVFGVMAWQRPVDLSHHRQDIVGMAKYCDVLSPMILSRIFFGMDGYATPGTRPSTSSASRWTGSSWSTKDSKR